MAVEATHLNFFAPVPQSQLIANSNERNGGIYNFTGQMGYGVAEALPESLIPFPGSMVCDSINAMTKTPMKAECESVVTYNVPSAQRKHCRDSILTKQMEMMANFTFPPQQNNNNNHLSYDQIQLSSFLGDEEIASHIYQHQLEIDHLVAHHAKKMRIEVEEREKEQARKLITAIGEGMMKKMKEKDEQIRRMWKTNWFLQERLKTLYMENKLWREMAQANEATANSLRINLEQVLAATAAAAAAAHANDERPTTGDDLDYAESCCDSSDNHPKEGEEKRRTLAEEEEMRKCKRCGKRESGVVLLPCRHLCLCTICGSSLPDACPVCHSHMTGSLHLNFSP
ncbi:hypothetical protein NMG60_11036508 [Bertholletia excelsa]